MRWVVVGFVLFLSSSLFSQDSISISEPSLAPFFYQPVIPDSVLFPDVDLHSLMAPAHIPNWLKWKYLASDAHLASDRVQVSDTLCIIGTGDIMLGTNYPSRTYLPPDRDCAPLLRPVHHLLQSGDLLFGNLEGVFCSEGGTPKKCRDTTRCYVFRMPDHFASCLVDAGYDVMSVANNHVNDFGPEGRSSTAAILDSLGIAYAGFVTHPWTTFEKGGVTYGFAAFAPNKGTMNLKNYSEAARITRMLDSVADVVIISFHGGGEGKEHQHVVRGDEEYLGYNRGSVYRFAHAVVDAGADVVFGHGPHVTRALELYSNRLICYSLGNFATYRRFNLRGPNGIAPIIKVFMDREGNFLSGEVVPVYQPGEGGPRIDPSKRAITKIIDLTREDFPDQDLIIGMDGLIHKE
ncbi:MAG: CapA family protein [Bacteroidota bacterium]